MEQEIKQKIIFYKKTKIINIVTWFFILAHSVASNFHWGTSIDNFYRPYLQLFYFSCYWSSCFFEETKLEKQIKNHCSLLCFVFYNF
jgi:hypothetical protein